MPAQLGTVVRSTFWEISTVCALQRFPDMMRALPFLLLSLACTASTDEAMVLVIDGNERVYDTVDAQLERDAELTRLEIRVSNRGREGVADDGWGTTLVVELDAAVLDALDEPRSLTIAGDASFTHNVDGYPQYPEEAIEFASADGHSAEIHRAWLTYSCFCTGYGDVAQPLQGTLVLEGMDDGRAYGRVDLHADALPLWDYGDSRRAWAST